LFAPHLAVWRRSVFLSPLDLYLKFIRSLAFVRCLALSRNTFFPFTRGAAVPESARREILAKKSFVLAREQIKGHEAIRPKRSSSRSAQMCSAPVFCQARKIFCVAMWKGAKCMKSDRGTFHRGEFVLIGYLFNLHPQPPRKAYFFLEACHFISCI